MAEKRHLPAVGTVAYTKLPRLEADPSQVHAASLCRAGVLPGHASNGHYSYQGTYFSYPLQSHESPELSVHWNPTDPYVPYTDGARSQRLRPEKARCMLSGQGLGGLGTWAQNPSYEKRKECLVGEVLGAQEKWADYSGHTDFIQQGWIQGYPSLHSSRVPIGCSSLVAPKPLYQNHVYCTDAGWSPKGTVASGTPAESLSKQPTNVEWTPPLPGHLVHTNCGSAMAKKSPVVESGFLPLHQSWKDAGTAPAGFSPYPKTFEHLQVAPSASPVDVRYPAGCKNQKSASEECARSPCGKAWSKPPSPASPLAGSHGLYQERSSACYPLPSYPLSFREQLALYQQGIAQAERQKALFASPACRSFSFPASEDPQLLSRTCFPPAPGSYYPAHLESYFSQSHDSPLVNSSGHQASREHKPQQNSQSKSSCEQRNPVLTYPVTERGLRSCSLPSREGARDWPGAQGTARPAGESFQCQQATPQPCAFQPLHSVSLDGCRQTEEVFYGADPCPLEKDHSRDEGPSCAEKRSSLSTGDKRRDAGDTFRSGACIVISDSPVTSQDSCLKGDSLNRISRSSDSTAQHEPQSPDKEQRGLTQTAAPPPPSSPPLPVIHNVFSLAPYREYLEGSTVSLRLSSLEECPVEKPSSDKSWQMVEKAISPPPPLAGSSKMPRGLPDGGKDVPCNVVEEVRGKASSSCVVVEKESGGCAGLCENSRDCPNAPATCWQGVNGCISEFAKDDHALDLSLRTDGSAEERSSQRPAGKSDALEKENGTRHGESGQEGPAKEQEAAVQHANPSASHPPPKTSSEEKSNFQSSAAFLYTKFKILKPYPVGPGSARRQNFSLFQSSSQIVALSSNLSLQQDSGQVATQQNSPTGQQDFQQAVTQQNNQTGQPNSQQLVSQQNSRTGQQDSQQAPSRQNHLQVQPSGQQAVTRQNSLPAQQSALPIVVRRNSLPALHIAHEKSAKPSAQRLSRKSLQQPNASKPAPPAGPASLGEAGAPLPPGCQSPAPEASDKRYFTTLHASICAVISESVSASSPELLREWLEKVEAEAEPEPKTAILAKAKSRSKTPEATKPSQGRQVWLSFKDAAGLLRQLQYWLETFLLARGCPFPHVVRAGTIFVPIHVVKEQLFGNLPSASVDHVLQAHKVELRPTTLTEEKLLRELDPKTRTLRMLKLLALKQLPDIYPDLLDLHWHHCLKQQLGSSSQAGLEASK